MFYSYVFVSAAALITGLLFIVGSLRVDNGGGSMSPVGALLQTPQVFLASGLFVGLPLLILT